MPSQLPALVRAMAEKGDIESLALALESGAVEGARDRIPVVCAIAPLAKRRNEPDVAQLCDAWLAKLGFGAEEKLSRTLTRSKAEHAKDLLDLGANPQLWMGFKEDGRQVTPLLEVFAKPSGAERDNLLEDMLVHLHENDLVPMCCRIVKDDKRISDEKNLFDALLSFPGSHLFKDSTFPASVLECLAKLELDEQWKLAAGDAIRRKCSVLDKQKADPHYDKVIANLMEILPVTRFGNPDGWGAVVNAIGRDEFARLLVDRFLPSKRDLNVLENMVADGFDLNRIIGVLEAPRADQPAHWTIHGNWLHLSIKAGRFDLFTKLLESGINPRTTLADLNPHIPAEHAKKVPNQRVIEITARPEWEESAGIWISTLDAALAKFRIDEVLEEAKGRKVGLEGFTAAT
jgi:hypothetical protein